MIISYGDPLGPSCLQHNAKGRMSENAKAKRRNAKAKEPRSENAYSNSPTIKIVLCLICGNKEFVFMYGHDQYLTVVNILES